MAGCSSGEGPDGSNCSLVLRIGSVSPQHGLVTVNCSGAGCSAALSNPPWDAWLRVDVESRQDNRTVSFSIVSNYTGDHRNAATHLDRPDHNRRKKYLPGFVCLCASVGCKPTSVGLIDDINKFRSNSSLANSTSAANSSVVAHSAAFSNESASLLTPLLSSSACVWNIPVLYEEVDVLSHRFTPVNGPNVSVTDTHPTLLTYPLHTQASGGTLNLQLTLNTVSVTTHRYSSLLRIFTLEPLRVEQLWHLFSVCVCVCV